MRSKIHKSKDSLPIIFRPLLWWVRWPDVDIKEDKDDIIFSAINEGTLEHWLWIINTYGKDEIRRVLERRLDSEFHPESKNLAQIIFSLRQFRHAR